MEDTINKQLNPYADSGALTRLYLATKVISNKLIEEIEKKENRKFGLCIYDNGEVKKILASPKLQMQYDMFAYMSPVGEKIIVYEFGKPKPIKTIECSPYTSDKKFFGNDQRFYRAIYARLSGRGAPHTIELLTPSYPKKQKHR